MKGNNKVQSGNQLNRKQQNNRKKPNESWIAFYQLKELNL